MLNDISMANNRKYYGLRFPFTAKDNEKFYIDCEYDPYAEIKSDLMHLLFTPTGQRIRDLQFGTKLIEYIFEPNDDKTYVDIKIELQEVVKKFLPGVTILELNVTNENNEAHGAKVNIKYEIDEGNYKTFDTLEITL